MTLPGAVRAVSRRAGPCAGSLAALNGPVELVLAVLLPVAGGRFKVAVDAGRGVGGWGGDGGGRHGGGGDAIAVGPYDGNVVDGDVACVVPTVHTLEDHLIALRHRRWHSPRTPDIALITTHCPDEGPVL